MINDDFDFLAHNGELANLIRNFEWEKTSLGPPSRWPQAVKVTTTTILQSPVPIVTLWGDEGIMIYNDAYSVFAGGRHPQLLGSKVREGWAEVADFNDNVMKVGLAGGTLAYQDQELTLHRQGRPEQVFMNLDYSPVMDEDGSPCGVIAIVVETTAKVMAERWRHGEQDRLRRMFEQAPGFIAMMRGPDHVFELTNAAYQQLVGHRDIIGKTARDALPDLEGQGYFELLDKVYQAGVAYEGQALAVDFQRSAASDVERKYVDLVYQPVLDADGAIGGIFAQGTDVTDRVAAEQALRASERQSRQILDGAIHYAILALDLNGRILRWNEGARRIFGWTEEETIALHWDMLFTPEDRAAGKARDAMDAALKHGSAHHDRWHIRKSGERFWANGEISVIRDEEGRPVGLVKVLRDRTEEYLAAQALRDTEAGLRRAQEAGGVGVFSLDLITNVLSPTPEFCKIYGLPEDKDVSIERIEELVLEEDRETASNSRTRTAGDSPLNVEYRIRRADSGQKRFIARRGEFERNADGVPVRFVGVVQDVTDRRKAQRDLRESEARFRALAQAIPNHVWTARPDGQLDWFNERVYEYAGASQGELDEDQWTRIVHPEDLDGVLSVWQLSLGSGQPYETEFRLRRADGKYRWHIVRAVPTKDEEGRVVRWIGTNTDIEDQRESRAKLEALNETLEQRVAERTADRDRMWRLSTDIMLVADFDARITAVNPAWTTIFEWDEQDLIGRSFIDLVHPDDRAGTLAELERLSEGATTFSFENRYQTKDGNYRRISWTAVPDEAFIHAVGRDVTEEREAAASLRKTELALQQAQKMEAIGNLTGGVAHDFNNLLQIVGGNLQLLVKDVAGNERAQSKISNALAGVDRGSKLAAQLLAFGRRQALDPRVVNVGRLIRAMDEMLRRTIGEGIEVETVISGGLWNTLIDPMQIENAVLNLAINARDAMDGFGRLTIEAGNAYIDDAYARQHQDVEPGQYVSLSVTDTGTGMPPELIEKVFEPFFSTKPEGKGTGLGLSMVYGFVRQTGGHVKIYSEPGHGTTVKIYLPRSMQQEDLEVGNSDLPIEGGPETILVAEDDEGVRMTVVEMLQELGYRVLKAPDAAAALSIIESGVHIDMLFTDVVMPGPLKSSEMARKAKERLSHLAVLFTSGYTENSIVHGGRLDPGVQLLSKPYTREALARKIRHVLNNEKHARAVLERKLTAKAGTPAAPATSNDERPRRILLVEDDMLIQMAAADMLSELGCDVLEAGSAEEALELLEKTVPDILVTDLGLPGMSGHDFCRQVRKRWPSLGIVFATGSDRVPDMEDTSRTALLLKPYGVEDLERALSLAG
ncbi:hybrid sensor histidine kinase/response regulator [Rhizobium grahamii]|uniref:histidine kinase n=1 Tax=Rhizobium grahamii CCGE 502 TaxID=990285 RepID=S3HT98_9HYPH|nr:PAS domain S-box protein [Rhizobium grahamii]EPE96451.1 sensor hybrid histidine kinase with multiple PAS/PAC and response regulator receiver domains [Rhizobium grahamii CCGE 502]